MGRVCACIVIERRMHTYTGLDSSVWFGVRDRGRARRDAWKRTGGARHTDINILSWNVINHRRIRRSSPAASSSLLSCYRARSPRFHSPGRDFVDSVRVTPILDESGSTKPNDRSRDDNYSNWFDYLAEMPRNAFLLLTFVKSSGIIHAVRPLEGIQTKLSDDG